MRDSSWCTGFFALSLLVSVCSAASAVRAEPSLLVVVEAPAGESFGRDVRAEIAQQLDLMVLSPREAASHGSTPNVVLAATIDASQLISVQYWDRAGVSDLLSAPLPASGATMEATVATLSVALLSRHTPRLRQLCLDPERELQDCSALANLRRGVVSLTSLSVPRVRGLPVTMDDF